MLCGRTACMDGEELVVTLLVIIIVYIGNKIIHKNISLAEGLELSSSASK